MGPAELSPRTELTAVFGMSGDDRARLARTGINSAGFRRSMWRGQASMTRVSCAASTTSTMLASSWLMLVSPLTALGERVDQPSTRHRGSGGFDRVLHPRPASGGSVRAGSAIRSIQQEPLLRCQPAAPTVGGDRGRRAAEDRHRSCGTPQDRGRIFPAGVKGVGGGDCRLQAISPGVGLPKRRLIGRRLGSRRFRISRRGVERSPVEVLTPTAGLVVVQKSAPSRRSRPTARPAKRSCRRREHGSTTNSPHR